MRVHIQRDNCACTFFSHDKKNKRRVNLSVPISMEDPCGCACSCHIRSVAYSGLQERAASIVIAEESRPTDVSAGGTLWAHVKSQARHNHEHSQLPCSCPKKQNQNSCPVAQLSCDVGKPTAANAMIAPGSEQATAALPYGA